MHNHLGMFHGQLRNFKKVDDRIEVVGSSCFHSQFSSIQMGETRKNIYNFSNHKLLTPSVKGPQT